MFIGQWRPREEGLCLQRYGGIQVQGVCIEAQAGKMVMELGCKTEVMGDKLLSGHGAGLLSPASPSHPKESG